MLIIGGSGSRKTNALFNSIKQQDSDNLIDKTDLYAKDLNEPKYQFLIKKRKDVVIKHLNDPKTLIEYSKYRIMFTIIVIVTIRKEKRKILIVFDDIIADIMTNKKFQPRIKEFSITCRKLNIYIVFVTKSYFFVPREVTLNSTHYTLINNEDS